MTNDKCELPTGAPLKLINNISGREVEIIVSEDYTCAIGGHLVSEPNKRSFYDLRKWSIVL